MDGDIAIKAEGLGKKYLIGHQSAERGGTLRDAIVRGVGSFARMGREMLRGRQIVGGDEIEEFWALKDLDFEIRRGDVVGVIGRNGAGKSTLLKVLSRITEPSEGKVSINGRVASLLEVGTGFHPELSGRENIFLNGAILGMSRAEIRRKFDEIVAFSEVEKFLDTPVKRYSSGMYVRLAFAVAAHLEPEILIVDEVLAVGDAEFQKKCLGKMQDVAGEGRTVLFVSHNTSAIAKLCTSGIFLEGGRTIGIGPVGAALDRYSGGSSGLEWVREAKRAEEICVMRASLDDLENSESRARLRWSLDLWSQGDRSCAVEILIKDRLMNPVVFGSIGTLNSATPVALRDGDNRVIVEMDLPSLVLGSYHASIWITRPYEKTYDKLDDILSFAVDRIHVGQVSHPINQGFNLGNFCTTLRVL